MFISTETRWGRQSLTPGKETWDVSLTRLGFGEINTGPRKIQRIPGSAMRPGTLTDQTQGKTQPPKERITEPFSKEEWSGGKGLPVKEETLTPDTQHLPRCVQCQGPSTSQDHRVHMYSSTFSCPPWCSHYAHHCIPRAWPRAEHEYTLADLVWR